MTAEDKKAVIAVKQAVNNQPLRKRIIYALRILEGETVLDFIGIELDDKYFSIAKDRIEKAQKEVQNVVA